MKKIHLWLMLLVSITFYGQTILNTKITPAHKEIFGTKISLIKPADFKLATNFLGFQQEETNSSIMALDFPTAFEKVSDGLNKENFEKQGVVVKSIDSIIFNKLPGYFISGTQAAYGAEFTKYILVFGSNTETIMINGAAPKDDSLLSESVKNAMLSTVYDAQRVLSPLDAVDFKISTTGTDFVFSKSMSNMLVYKREEKVAVEKDDNASLVVVKSISKSAFGDKKEYAINRMKGFPTGINKVLTTEAITINGLEGFEITAEGINRRTGQKENAYMTVLFNDLDCYFLYGTSSKNNEQNNLIFKKLAQTFKLK